MKKNIYFYTNLLAWGLVLLLAGNYVFGWVTPTLDPPEGDLSAPLDMSSTAQTKSGNLTIDSLLKVGRYSSAPTGATGALYYDTTDNEFKGYKASSWDSLGGGEDTDTWITTQTCSTDYALQSVGKTSKTCINKVDYSDIAYDVSCTDCIGTTEIADSYVLNTSDSMSGNLTITGTLGTTGDVTIGGGSGKLNVGTIDPIYTINGKRYATYLPGMIGVKEETTGVIKLQKSQLPITDYQNTYSYLIDFNNLEEGSDLWLFAKTINLKEDFDKMIVLLTPAFDGQVWYDKDIDKNYLTIFAIPNSLSGFNLEISYRLAAPRFDSNRWTNYSDSEFEGFNLDKLLK